MSVTSVAAKSEPLLATARPGPLPRVRVSGKFFYAGDEKLYVKAVSYGPFRPADGAPFPSRERARQDFVLMRELGANTFRTFTPPPRWLLDLAAEHGLRVIVGVPWAQQVCFLDDPEIVRDSRRRIADAARDVGRHPAVLALFVGNETPPDIVRWHGPERVQAFLRSLYDEAKDGAPDTLVSYANYPPTEYLDLDFLDFLSFNVYLHREPDFRRYLLRLQNLAEDRPLFLSEFGIDSIREGPGHQAEILRWQVRAAFEVGVAGVTVFSWTDDWFALSWQTGGGFQVEDWAFGLVDAERRPKPAFAAVRETFAAPLPPLPADAPMISVVVCAYNAERTMDACLASLADCPYPNYEVIVVNDGSTDATGDIAHRYEGGRIRVIDQPNMGLSAARNVGSAAARGEIVAYTDSDCVVDPDWLTYLAYKFEEGFVAVGGPNFPPPEDTLVPSAVAVSPGGPTHVLVNDEVAEHIPGCNMAFLKTKLDEIGGFDVAYTAAGDDVDLCWRLQNAGYSIGFSPAAMVWHFRRNTVRAYLKQQMGYGKAEAMLFAKHPLRFNLLGQSRWLGRIYGDLTTSFLTRRPVIYYGTFGEGLFQTLYERPASFLTYLPFTLEWNLVAAVLLLTAVISGEYLVASSLPFAISVASAANSAARAKLDPRFRGPRARLLVMALLYLGPLVRSFERYLWRMRGTKEGERFEGGGRVRPSEVSWLRRTFQVALWSEAGHEKQHLLHELMSFLAVRKYRIAIDSGWNEWDIEVSRGFWTSARIEVAVENHTGAKRLFRVRVSLHTAKTALWAFLACVAVAVLGFALDNPDLSRMGVVLGLLDVATIAYQNFRLGRVLLRVFDALASRLELTPVVEAKEPAA
ncbi:MAG: glycosyltransferase [Thermodesulfobacteriota bacterium]